MKYGWYAAMGLAAIAGLAIGLWQIYVIATMIYPEWGIAGLVVAYLLYPLTIMLSPWYAGLVLADWSYMLFYPAALAVYVVWSASHAMMVRERGYS